MIRTPKTAQVIREFSKEHARRLRVALPAVVDAYYPATAISRPMIDATPVFTEAVGSAGIGPLPKVTNVPIQYPCTASTYLRFPLAKGDGVLLIFSDKSLDKWLAAGGPVDPQDTRTHDLSDAIAIPGLFPHITPFVDTHEGDLVLGFTNPAAPAVFANVRIKLTTGDVIVENGPLAKVKLGSENPTDSATGAGALYNWLSADLLTTYVGGLIASLVKLATAIAAESTIPTAKAAANLFLGEITTLTTTTLTQVEANYATSPPINPQGKGVGSGKVKI